MKALTIWQPWARKRGCRKVAAQGPGMRALTIWQPWASLIMAGAKRYEWRGWRAPDSVVGQRIVIHAGSRPMRSAELRALRRRINSRRTDLDVKPALELVERILAGDLDLPRASGLGTALLGSPRRASEIFPDDADADPDMWGWPLTEIRPFEPIVPARGFQGFWPWPHDIPEAS